MKKIGKSFLFAIFGLLSNPGFAQLTVNTPTSDNANDVGSTTVQGSSKLNNLYGVDLYTGTANVSLPIFNYPVDNLNLGVSLEYSTRGQKVDQIAGSTGLGFSLNFGGSIQRDVFGIDDELTMRGLTGIGPYGNYTLLSGQKGYWGFVFNTGPQHEKEFDLFHAAIGNRSFQFTISGFSHDANGNVVAHCNTYPKSEIKIDVYEVNPNWPAYGAYPGIPITSSGAFAGIDDTMSQHYYVCFVITDEKGNRFFFDRGDYELKYYNQEGAIDPYFYYSTDNWVLDKIVTRTNDTIKYTYLPSNYLSYPLSKDEKVKEVLDHHESKGIQWDTAYLAHAAIIADSTINWKGYYKHLSKIEYPDGTQAIFNFEDNPNITRCDLPGGQVVKSITIKNINDNTGKAFTYQFNYAYFRTPDINNSTLEIPYGSSCGIASSLSLRLKLKSIDKIGIDGSATERFYTFDYNSTPLPRRLSPSRDYYGYFNGHNSQYSSTGISNPVDLSGLSIPLHVFKLTPNASYTYGVDRTPDVNYMQACNLKSITNSLGGKVSFSYKDHSLYNPQYSYGNNLPGNIGTLPTNFEGADANDGLCIDEITLSDGFNVDNSIKTKYDFSGGQRFFRGGYFWDPAYFLAYTDQIGQDSFVYYRNTYTNNYVTPRQLFNGSNHGYTYVVERRYGTNNELLGSTKHKFTNLMDENDSTVSNLMVKPRIVLGGGQNGLRVLINQFHPVHFYQYRMGLELETDEYDPNGDLQSSIANTYEDNTQLYVDAGPNLRYVQYNTGTDAQAYYSDQYTHFYPKLRRIKNTVSTKYSSSNQMSAVTYYNYDVNDNVTNEIWTDSKGDTFTKKVFYNYSLVNNSPIFDSTVFSSDLQFQVVSELWKKVNGIDFLLGYSKTNPPGYSGIDLNDYYSLKTKIPVSLTQYNSPSFMSANVTEDKHYTFDPKGNVIEGRYNNGSIYASAIWDMKNGKKIANVDNAKYNQVAYTSFEGSFNGLGNFDYNKGNWDFDPSGVIYSINNGLVKPLSGSYHYQLPQSGSPISSSNLLQSNIAYKLTFWATAQPTVTVGTQPITVSIVAEKQYWKLYSATINGYSGILNISSTSGTVNIDELRLHPFYSRMETATYDPLLGQTSKVDAQNNILYYQYDKMGRLNVTRDRDGNIRTFSQETIQGADY